MCSWKNLGGKQKVIRAVHVTLSGHCPVTAPPRRCPLRVTPATVSCQRNAGVRGPQPPREARVPLLRALQACRDLAREVGSLRGHPAPRPPPRGLCLLPGNDASCWVCPRPRPWLPSRPQHPEPSERWCCERRGLRPVHGRGCRCPAGPRFPPERHQARHRTALTTAHERGARPSLSPLLRSM